MMYLARALAGQLQARKLQTKQAAALTWRCAMLSWWRDSIQQILCLIQDPHIAYIPGFGTKMNKGDMYACGDTTNCLLAEVEIKRWKKSD